MKRTMKDRLNDLMAGKGFYIVLLLCVTALGVSGYYLFSDMSRQAQTVSAPVTVVVTPTPYPEHSVPPETPEPPTTAPPTPSGAVQTPAPTAAPAPSAPATATATASVFTWPVKGEVLRSWSVDRLAYDKTMADWRTHDGIDIACSLGAQVMAPAGGTVTQLYTDDLMGTTVVITHADGVVSACANLAGVPAVAEGDTVRTGQVIGSVGKSAIAESAEGAHLHLNMTKDGVSVDPLDYLPKN